MIKFLTKFSIFVIRSSNLNSLTFESSDLMLSFTFLSVMSNAVLQSVLSRVECRILCFLLSLYFLQQFPLLLRCESLSVDSFVFALEFCELRLVLLFFFGSSDSRILLLWLGRLHVVLWLSEVDLDVCFNAADLIVWLTLSDVDEVVTTTVVDADCVAFVENRVMSQFLFQNCLWVRKINERRLVWLDLDERSLLQVHVSEDDLGAFADAEIVHHPDGNVAHAFLS